MRRLMVGAAAGAAAVFLIQTYARPPFLAGVVLFVAFSTLLGFGLARQVAVSKPAGVAVLSAIVTTAFIVVAFTYPTPDPNSGDNVLGLGISLIFAAAAICLGFGLGLAKMIRRASPTRTR